MQPRLEQNESETEGSENAFCSPPGFQAGVESLDLAGAQDFLVEGYLLWASGLVFSAFFAKRLEQNKSAAEGLRLWFAPGRFWILSCLKTLRAALVWLGPVPAWQLCAWKTDCRVREQT